MLRTNRPPRDQLAHRAASPCPFRRVGRVFEAHHSPGGGPRRLDPPYKRQTCFEQTGRPVTSLLIGQPPLVQSVGWVESSRPTTPLAVGVEDSTHPTNDKHASNKPAAP